MVGGRSSRTAVTIEDAFNLRTPEAFGPGIMDDRIVWRHWTRFRRILAPDLPPEFQAERYTPLDLSSHCRAALRVAIREVHNLRRAEIERAIITKLPDEEARQLVYTARPWPRVHRSIIAPTAGFDPVSDERFADARRCHQCFGRKLQSVYRALVAYACLLIALGEPVPNDISADLAIYIAEEIACLPLAEEFSGYEAWTIRSGNLRVFGAHVDPEGRTQWTSRFDYPSRVKGMPGEPVNMASPFLWRDSFGRDLDGFLQTPLGRIAPSGLRASARISPTLTAIGHEQPTLVFWTPCDANDRSSQSTTPLTLVSLLHPATHIWGPPLSKKNAAEVKIFIERNQSSLLAHYRNEIDSAELADSIFRQIGRG